MLKSPDQTDLDTKIVVPVYVVASKVWSRLTSLFDICCVLYPSSIRRLATLWTYFLYLSLSSVILIDSSTRSPVHVLMLSIQAVRRLFRLLALALFLALSLSPGVFVVSSWFDHSMLASLL